MTTKKQLLHNLQKLCNQTDRVFFDPSFNNRNKTELVKLITIVLEIIRAEEFRNRLIAERGLTNNDLMVIALNGPNPSDIKAVTIYNKGQQLNNLVDNFGN